MNTTILSFIAILSLGLIVYFTILRILHRFELPDLDIRKLLPDKPHYKALALFPHPDDETMASGSLISHLASRGDVDLKVIVATRGEMGDEVLKLPPDQLGEIREGEFSEAMKALGVRDYEMWDCGDGKMRDCMEASMDKLRKLHEQERYDLVITYEKNGLYGHPDHIALAKLVQQLQAEFPEIVVVRTTLPDKIFQKLNLPKEILGEKLNISKISEPEFKFQGIRYNWKKYRAVKAYKSQNLSHNGSPLLHAAVMVFEYYTTKY